MFLKPVLRSTDLLVFFVSRGLDPHSAVPKIAVNHATWDVNSPKPFETCIHGQCYEYFFLCCVFGVMEAFDSKEIINTLKRYYVNHGMRWRCKFHFRYVTDKILFTLQIYFARSVSLTFSEYFSQFSTRTELSTSFIEASLENGRKMKSLQAKQRTRWNMQGLRHW